MHLLHATIIIWRSIPTSLLDVLVWPRMDDAKVTCSSRDTSANFMLWWRRNWLSNLLVETWRWWPGRWTLKLPTTDFLSKCFQGWRSCFKIEPDLCWEHIPGVWISVPSSEGKCDHDDKIWMRSRQCLTGAACRVGLQGKRMLSGGKNFLAGCQGSKYLPDRMSTSWNICTSRYLLDKKSA